MVRFDGAWTSKMRAMVCADQVFARGVRVGGAEHDTHVDMATTAAIAAREGRGELLARRSLEAVLMVSDKYILARSRQIES